MRPCWLKQAFLNAWLGFWTGDRFGWGREGTAIASFNISAPPGSIPPAPPGATLTQVPGTAANWTYTVPYSTPSPPTKNYYLLIYACIFVANAFIVYFRSLTFYSHTTRICKARNGSFKRFR